MEFLQELTQKSGIYKGEGVNHEGEKFLGRLEIITLFESKTFQIKFTASSVGGLLFHDEVSLLSKDEQGQWCLFNTNSNNDQCLVHLLESSDVVDDKRTLNFMYGDYKKEDTFRERVCLDLYKENKIAYHYYWGVPGGGFQYRSGLIMELCQN
ncbi:hypothetical protein MJH12_05400 [bacterium]|nr:hypothetical protein [bacterium]